MKRVIFMLFVLLLLGVTACTLFVAKDTATIQLNNYKHDNIGRSAVIHEDRIYYVSNEHEDVGIYSMNLDGSDIRMEFLNPSITMIEVIDEKLYFVGLKAINKKADSYKDVKNEYGLYCGTIGGSDYQTERHYGNDNLKEFYLNNNGYQMYCSGAKDEQIVIGSSVEIDVRDYYQSSFIFDYKNDTVEGHVYRVGDCIIISDKLADSTRLYANTNAYVLDTNTGVLVLKSYNSTSLIFVKAHFIDDNQIYCSYNNMIVVIDAVTLEVKQNITPDALNEDCQIRQVISSGSNIYIIAEEQSQDTVNEKLYEVDKKTLQASEVEGLGIKQRILGLTDSYIVACDKESIYKFSLSDGILGEEVKLYDVPKDFYTTNYMIDYAGDWMFIYKIYPEKGSIYDKEPCGQQLLCEINLVNSEVFPNDVELEFSE